MLFRRLSSVPIILLFTASCASGFAYNMQAIVTTFSQNVQTLRKTSPKQAESRSMAISILNMLSARGRRQEASTLLRAYWQEWESMPTGPHKMQALIQLMPTLIFLKKEPHIADLAKQIIGLSTSPVASFTVDAQQVSSQHPFLTSLSRGELLKDFLIALCIPQKLTKPQTPHISTPG